MPQKKDKDRKEGKGHRCCLGNRIYSIPCHTRYIPQTTQDDFEEKDEKSKDQLAEWML